jgi:hypothetical protein
MSCDKQRIRLTQLGVINLLGKIKLTKYIMLIEYYATDLEDRQLEKALDKFDILEWFNPEDGYFVLETNDQRVVTIMALFNLELYITERDYERK